MIAHPPADNRHAASYAGLALVWAIFVAYGSLVPLDYTPRPYAWRAFLDTPWLQLGVGSRADWVANILLYLMLMYLATGAIWASRMGIAVRVMLQVVVLAACLFMAIGIEYLQLFFPPRTVSLNDLVAEAFGALVGTALWFVVGKRVSALWSRFMSAGAHSVRALLALYAVAYLAFSLFPYDFLVSAQELADKLGKPGSIGLAPGASCGPMFTCGVKLLVEAALMMPFGVLLVLAARQSRKGVAVVAISTGFALGALIGLLVEAAQVVLASGVTQGISVVTRGLGMAWGVMLVRSDPLRAFHRLPMLVRKGAIYALPFYLALVLALNDLLPLQFQPMWAASEKLQELRFLPFYYHYYTTETAAVRSLLFVAGSYAPLGLVAALAYPGFRRTAAWLCALVAVALCLGVEVLKLFSVAKRPDPTNLLIAASSAWLMHWVTCRLLMIMQRRSGTAESAAPEGGRSSLAGVPITRGSFVLSVLAPIAALLLVVAVFVPSAPPVSASSAASVTYPPPEALPVPNLPGFVDAHPRLPHPSPRDIAALRVSNPGFLDARRKAARQGTGDFEASILMAMFEPGSQGLAKLHQRLMGMKFHDRGDRQVKPLALAYDWLYLQWTAPERVALQDKLVEGCAYVITVIRKEQLSPFNAFLYNSPLQALMACSIALNEDHPRGEAFMAFTHEIWKSRVLPVWRQVMGRNGGWHEGGEYVAVSIGQAIHSLPAMWRHATGEDLFRTEPGIRGFLDFLVYRTRPDGTQMRWGDGAWFDRHPVDAIPLALEFRHAAAYSLAPPKNPSPAGWPWGPLTDHSLIDPGAAARLPLSQLFDGIGMVIARSDWSPDATWVSFKAGDNYWSHTHLDQGAFTLFKGGPLAIDSGWYGPAYGSDHHMNYSYQSIAHNLVTVTDPADTQPGPGFDTTPRAYANDGGQRRIGSGWGVAPAPLDLEQWRAQHDTYHTGRIARHLNADGLTIAVADVTPAYTNKQSGRGTFQDRTRRVERMWRVFGYDHVNDAVIVFDDVVATKAAFRKRWLLHSLEAPQVSADGFSLFVPEANRSGRRGGQLQGHVLEPRNPVLHVVGGPGFEFFADDRNHDEGGKVQEAVRKLGPGRAEPGAWRIELMPPDDAREDRFLVVMFPSLAGPAGRKATAVRLERDGWLGAEVAGPDRTTRWWYQPGRHGVRVEVVEAGQTRVHDLMDASP
jgi:VanZ family protein